MVIPGMPALIEDLGVSGAEGNLAMFSFLVAMAVGQLFSGTLSDSFGRKPVMVAGALLLAASSLLCAASSGVELLVAARIPQGLGAGALMTLVSTVVTDSYQGADFERSMTVLQSLGILGPVAAPFMGSVMLSFFTWRAVFVLLAVLSALCLACVLLMSETLPSSQRSPIRLSVLFGSMAEVCRIPGFLATTAAVSLAAMPLLAFLSVSAYIYLTEFGMGYASYSLFYAVCSLSGIASPFVYLRLVKRGVPESLVAKVCMAGFALSGVLMLSIGTYSELCVMASVLPLFVFEGVFRAQTFVALLEGLDEARGAANSAANFIYNLCSSWGTVGATAVGAGYLFNVGAMTVLCAAGVVAIWVVLTMRKTLLPKFR